MEEKGWRACWLGSIYSMCVERLEEEPNPGMRDESPQALDVDSGRTLHRFQPCCLARL